jgi:hypothetical protein
MNDEARQCPSITGENLVTCDAPDSTAKEMRYASRIFKTIHEGQGVVRQWLD